MQELQPYLWDTSLEEDDDEETVEEVGFWTNLLSTFLSISWMITIFFYCCVSGAAPSLHIDVGAQMAPYVGTSALLTLIWMMNKIYSGIMKRRATSL